MIALYFPCLEGILEVESTANYKIPNKSMPGRHIDDNEYLLSKSESDQRILIILKITASILILFSIVLLYGVSNLQTKNIDPNTIKSVLEYVLLFNV